MDKLFKSFFGLKDKFEKAKKVFKGSSMTPFLCIRAKREYLKQLSKANPGLYIGIISVVLFGAISLGAGTLSKSLSEEGDFLLATISEVFDKTPKKDYCLSPREKFLPESPEFLFVENCTLRAASPLVDITPQVLGMWLGEGEMENRREVTEYIVEEGDSLWSIAARFDISLDTILWANDLKTLLIRPDQKLLILPISGVIHLVKEGDTINEIAEKYKTESKKIISFNDLSGESDIFPGEVLIIPDGRLPSVSIVGPADTSSRLSTNNFYGKSHAYPYGQCTWWVAQKRAIPSWGNAKNWLDNALVSGFPVCKGSYCIPQVGAVISLKGNRIYGHVGYVEEVKGDKVVFSEMNYIGWGRMNYRTLRVGSSSIKGYIY